MHFSLLGQTVYINDGAGHYWGINKSNLANSSLNKGVTAGINTWVAGSNGTKVLKDSSGKVLKVADSNGNIIQDNMSATNVKNQLNPAFVVWNTQYGVANKSSRFGGSPPPVAPPMYIDANGNLTNNEYSVLNGQPVTGNGGVTTVTPPSSLSPVLSGLKDKIIALATGPNKTIFFGGVGLAIAAGVAFFGVPKGGWKILK